MNHFFLSIIIIVISFSCALPKKVESTQNNQNQDILILASMINKELNTSNIREYNLENFHLKESLNRISSNFLWTKMEAKEGYISLKFKFSKVRQNNITLTNEEIELAKLIKIKVKKQGDLDDGEIKFAYPERFYRVKQILLFK